MTKRLINQFAAIVAAAFMSLFWFFIYTQSHVYSENLSMLINLTLLYVLQFWQDSYKKYLLSGLLLGLSVACRPEIMLFAGFILIWMFFNKIKLKKLIQFYILFLLTFLLVIVPVLIRNHTLSGEFLLRQQVGANFYMGNNPDFKGSNIYVERGQIWNTFINMPYRELNVNRPLKESEINNFYRRKTFELIKNDPLGWLKFMTMKAYSVFLGVEFLRTEDVYFYDNYITPTPLKFLQTRHIFALAFMGLFLTFFHDRRKGT